MIHGKMEGAIFKELVEKGWKVTGEEEACGNSER
jgi:hypothetical protein